MKVIYWILFFVVSVPVSAQEEYAIRNVLKMQEECWNEGDIECFMDGYWRSDKLAFIRSTGVNYGWESVLEDYKKRYPSKEEMGELSFEIKIIEPLSEEFWFVAGKWNLDRENDTPNGHFTLIFRNIDDDWVIVSDHTS
jgi:hypothetical protein